MELKIETVDVVKEEEINFILGQSHFIKTVEDLYEVLVGSVPGIEFGLAFVESSGACKVRVEGNNGQLKQAAAENALEIGAGRSQVCTTGVHWFTPVVGVL